MNYQETVNAVNQVIAQYDMPLTLRQIYYRLVAAGRIPNRRSAYNGLSAQLVKARENREVDERRVVDRSRSIIDLSYDSPEEFLDDCESAMDSYFVRRFWESQAYYVEVWVEKDALSQVLSGAIREFNTVVAPSRGYSSFSYIREAARRISRYTGASGFGANILHFADHDPSGLDMTRDLQNRFNAYSREAVEVKRIALTFDQVQQYDLIPNPTKITDPRAYGYMAQYGDECWELDAIEPDELVRLVHEATEAEITDRVAWDEIKAQDEEERADIRERLADMKREYGA